MGKAINYHITILLPFLMFQALTNYKYVLRNCNVLSVIWEYPIVLATKKHIGFAG